MEFPEPSELRPVVVGYAQVLAQLELEPGEQALVLPNGEWFPDKFTGDADSLSLLVARMQGYAGLEEIEIETALSGETAEGSSCGTGGCGSGGCGTSSTKKVEAPTLTKTARGYLIEVNASAMSHPIAFTAAIARMLGHVRLLEAGKDDPNAKETGVEAAELAATQLGFGVLLLEASYLYSKSCGGPSVGKATVLSCPELALALACFLDFEGQKPRAALAELATTQKAALDEAWTLVQSNPELIQKLKSHPNAVASGKFQLKESRSWLSRLFGQKPSRPKDSAQAALEALERGDSLEHVEALLGKEAPAVTPRSAKTPRAEDDLRDLIDEALAETRAEREREELASAGRSRY
ncbi:MAG TPA: hypothetical protein VFQ61_31945 [Polyangiaceae bacterium]|nr:hypothetical protein [Polyangiaceae bacterium]